MHIISKCSNGFHLEETTRFIIKVLLNRVIFNKKSKLYSALKMNIISKCLNGFHLKGNYAIHKKSIIEPRNFQ